MDRFSQDALTEFWPCGKKPATFDRAGRVALLGEFAEAALSGKPPSRESLLFVAGAIRAWLAGGGSLEADYLQVTGKAGSHITPAALWQTLCDGSSEGAQPGDDKATIPPTSTEGLP